MLDNPPTLPGGGVINSHAKWKGGQARGRSILKYGGVASYSLYPSEGLFPLDSTFPSIAFTTPISYVIIDTPTVDEMAAATFTYQGGHIYYVDDAEAAALTLAGFTVTPDPLTLFPLPNLYPEESLFPGFQTTG